MTTVICPIGISPVESSGCFTWGNPLNPRTPSEALCSEKFYLVLHQVVNMYWNILWTNPLLYACPSSRKQLFRKGPVLLSGAVVRQDLIWSVAMGANRLWLYHRTVSCVHYQTLSYDRVWSGQLLWDQTDFNFTIGQSLVSIIRHCHTTASDLVSCHGSKQTLTLPSDSVLWLMRIAHVGLLSDTRNCLVVTSKSVCRRTVLDRRSGPWTSKIHCAEGT